MKSLLTAVVVVLCLVTTANAQSRYGSFMARSNRAEAQKRYDASRSKNPSATWKNYPKHVERKDFFQSPTQRMETDRKIQAREFYERHNPDSSRLSRSTNGTGTGRSPVYGKNGRYLGSVISTKSGTQIYRDQNGRILSRSELDRRGTTRYFYGQDGNFQGRISGDDNTSSMEKFLEGR